MQAIGAMPEGHRRLSWRPISFGTFIDGNCLCCLGDSKQQTSLVAFLQECGEHASLSLICQQLALDEPFEKCRTSAGGQTSARTGPRAFCFAGGQGAL